MRHEGKVYVEATLTFKGSVDLLLWEDMKIGEVIAEIIESGDYEYDVIRGNLDIEDVEPVDDWEDYYERE